ncbi:hypothetical protein EVAR_91648_1 [Eumeta japonica]|uniref:Uncharacterized protein n=1 Tax=Eumeta variegata TaxID=151549 RepID=A0A4C1Z5T4_EUMVA|nr:hypothetical protein EVAR_91648_1 [Eumeta japonica]
MKLHATISNTKSRQSWKNKNARNNGELKKSGILVIRRESLREATSRHRSMNRKRNEETPPTAPTSAPTQNPKRIETEATTLRTTNGKNVTLRRNSRKAWDTNKGSGTVHGRKHGKGIGFGSPWGRAAFHFRQDLPTS